MIGQHFIVLYVLENYRLAFKGLVQVGLGYWRNMYRPKKNDWKKLGLTNIY